MYSKEHNKNNKFLELRDDLFCQFCNKQCTSLNSLKQHELRCKNNPNHLAFPHPIKDTFGDSRGWAKGLTKETDVRIAKQADNLKKKYADKSLHIWCEGKHIPEQTRAKIAETMRGNTNWINSLGKAGVGLKGTYKGIKCDSSFELAYVLYCFDQDKIIKRCTKTFEYFIDGKKHIYYPDFEVDNTIVEIKGFWQQNLAEKVKAVENSGYQIKVYLPEDMEPIIRYIFDKYKAHSGKELASLYDI